MRSSGEPEWFERRFCVPLTGREPVLGRIRERLRSRGPGSGWITIHAPAGAGTSRLLDEVAALLRSEGEPAPLRITATGPDEPPLEPLRRALAPLFAAATPLAVERALAAVLPAPSDRIRLLAAWLLAGSGCKEPVTPPGSAVRELLERVAGGGPLLVDGLASLDADCQGLLRRNAAGRGPAVVAGTTTAVPQLATGMEIVLEPLGESQVELLLRRWLKHAATARRLAPVLTASCEGWPGRVVEAVRQLARAGRLRRERRGVVVVNAPTRWPDGRPTGGALLDWIRTQGSAAQRVLEVAAVQRAPDDPRLLADAVGVHQRYVAGLLSEARAWHVDAAPGGFFADAKQRSAFRTRLAPERIAQAVERLLAAWDGRPSHEWLSPRDACLRLRSAVAADHEARTVEALTSVVRIDHAAQGLEGWALEGVADAALLLTRHSEAHTELAAAALDLLWRAGWQDAAVRIGEARAEPELPTVTGALLARARQVMRRGSSEEGRRVLEASLATLRSDVPHAGVFDAWRLLGCVRLLAGDLPAAREALREAGAALPGSDLERRAALHRDLASLARARQRVRAACAHLSRAGNLLLAAGATADAAAVLAELGALDVEAGRSVRGVGALVRSAELYALMDAPEPRARSLYRVGRVLSREGVFERAVEHLGAALESAESAGLGDLLPRIHLALSQAHGGRGHLARERDHATMAASTATNELDRLRARAVLAQSDLRAGRSEALEVLVACERALRAAGYAGEALQARAALCEARLCPDGSPVGGVLPVPEEQDVPLRLAVARLRLAHGDEEEALAAFTAIAADLGLRPDQRATACAHLADAHGSGGRAIQARSAAVRAASLLHLSRRSCAEDARLHRILTRVFKRLGEPGRAASHRVAARRGLRTLVALEGDALARRRLARAFWRRDPRTRRPALDAAG